MDIDFFNRMDTVVVQLTTGFETSSEANATITSHLKDQLTSIGDSFGPDSDIFKQLIENKEACGSLHGRFESIGPNISILYEAIQGLGEKEMCLVQQMEELGSGISQTRIAMKEPPACLENHNNSTAIAEMESRLEKMSQELAMAQEALQAKDSESESTKRSLLETSKTAQETEARAVQHECEVAALQQKIQSIESKVREELNRASVISRDQTRAKFEQQLHKIVKEKEDAEKEMQKTKEILDAAQQSQVKNTYPPMVQTATDSRKLQNDTFTEHHQKEMESLVGGPVPLRGKY